MVTVTDLRKIIFGKEEEVGEAKNLFFKPFLKKLIPQVLEGVLGVMARLLFTVVLLFVAGSHANVNFGNQKCGDPTCNSKILNNIYSKLLLIRNTNVQL